MAQQNKVAVNLAQDFTDEQKAQARQNIGAAASTDVTNKSEIKVFEGGTSTVHKNLMTIYAGSSTGDMAGITFNNENSNVSMVKKPAAGDGGKVLTVVEPGGSVASYYEWQDSHGLPTGGTAGQALILDSNGNPIWSDNINNTYGSYTDTYNGANKEVELNEIDLRGAALTAGTDNHILTLKSTEFAGIGGNTRFTKQYELVPHNSNSRTSGYVHSDGYGLTKKDISVASHFTITWPQVTAPAATAAGLTINGDFSSDVPANSLVFIMATLSLNVSIPQWDITLLNGGTTLLGCEINVSGGMRRADQSSYSMLDGIYGKATIPARMFNPDTHGNVIHTSLIYVPVFFVFETSYALNGAQFVAQYIYGNTSDWYMTSAQVITNDAFYIPMEQQ